MAGFPGLPYYLNLLTSEYKGAPNFNAFVGAKLQVYSDIASLFTGMLTAFDIDQTQGVQLDILGQFIGASRTLSFQPSGGVSPILDDVTYQTYLKAKIAQNHWDGTIDGMFNAWQTIFPGGRIVIHDNQNMTATVFVSGSFTSILEDLISNGFIVPRPEGVLYNYVFGLPAFGFDRNDTYVAGFDDGLWS